jgi:hypothetical protein
VVSAASLTLILLALPPVTAELSIGNVDFFLGALLVIAWWGILRADAIGDRAAGVAIGVAAVVKVFPAVLIVWLVLSDRWRPARWAVIGGLVAILATLPITGIQPWLEYPAVLLNMGGPIDDTFAIAPATWLSPLVGPAAGRAIVYLLALAILAWLARRSRPGAGRAAAGLGFAGAVTVSLLVTPILWTHYLTLAAVPMLIGLETGIPLAIVAVLYLLFSVQNQAALGDLGFLLSRVGPTIGLFGLLGVLLRTRLGVAQPGEAA